jgi:hypothetical protein
MRAEVAHKRVCFTYETTVECKLASSRRTIEGPSSFINVSRRKAFQQQFYAHSG